MRITAIILLLAFCINSHAQNFQNNPFLNDSNGQPLHWGAQYVADGNPYFMTEYIPAEITLANGKSYTDVKVKYNLLDHLVQYQLDDGTEMITLSPVKKIRFANVATDDGLVPSLTLEAINGLLNEKESDVYQVLDSGQISYLRKLIITYRDDQKYGDATITRYFERKQTDYIRSSSGTLTKVDKGRSFITGFMNDKKTAVDDFIAKNNLACKSTQDILTLVRFYNSLF